MSDTVKAKAVWKVEYRMRKSGTRVVMENTTQDMHDGCIEVLRKAEWVDHESIRIIEIPGEAT